VVFVSQKNKVEAEERLRGEPRPLKHSDFQRLRLSYEAINGGKIDEDCLPSAGLVERILGEIEEGEFEATPLDEVATKLEAARQGTSLDSTVMRDGFIKITRQGKVKVSAPKDPEDLRFRLKVLGLAMGLVKLKLSNTIWLRTMEHKLFNDHTEHILGSKIYLLRARNDSGDEVGAPSWNLILNYEHELRRKGAELINMEGMSIQEAFIAARNDQDTKTNFFTTPLAVSVHAGGSRRGKASGSGRERSRSPANPKKVPAVNPPWWSKPGAWEAYWAKGDGGGKGSKGVKSKGKEKGKKPKGKGKGKKG
jgi:hypothetical protein